MVVGPIGLGIGRLGNLFDNGQQVSRSLDRSDAKRGPGPFRRSPPSRSRIKRHFSRDSPGPRSTTESSQS